MALAIYFDGLIRERPPVEDTCHCPTSVKSENRYDYFDHWFGFGNVAPASTPKLIV